LLTTCQPIKARGTYVRLTCVHKLPVEGPGFNQSVFQEGRAGLFGIKGKTRFSRELYILAGKKGGGFLFFMEIAGGEPDCHS
jgi:hypothetical protein